MARSPAPVAAGVDGLWAEMRRPTGEASILSTVTEIPEHLLKRSRERRAAIGKGGDAPADSGTSSESEGAGAAVEKSAPAAPAAASTGPAARTAASEPPPPAPPKPDPPYVAAAKSRRKIPFWAMATLSLMPLWAFMYVRALTDGGEAAAGPLGEGEEVYSNCSSCHGGAGGGGVGYAFTEGEVLETFPNIEDHIRYVYYGTEQYNIAGVDVYGNPDRDPVHITGNQGVMPGFGDQLTDHAIVAVICHERYTLGGADPTSEEYAAEFEAWCSPDGPLWLAVEEGEIVLESDDEIEEVEVAAGPVVVTPIGSAPIPGSP